jgi:hypothetical protein
MIFLGSLSARKIICSKNLIVDSSIEHQMMRKTTNLPYHAFLTMNSRPLLIATNEFGFELKKFIPAGIHINS